MRAAIFARNITDEDNIKGGIDFNNNTAFVNEPRIVGVSLKGSELGVRDKKREMRKTCEGLPHFWKEAPGQAAFARALAPAAR